MKWGVLVQRPMGPQFIIAARVMCMKASGYDFNYDNRNCSGPSSYVVSEKPNAYCYVPDTEWGRLGQTLENFWDGRKTLN